MANDSAKRQMTALRGCGQAERVIYRPAGKPGAPASGTPREITAIVDRGPPEDILHVRAPALRVSVLNDEIDGISAALLDVGTDRIDAAERFGGTRQTRGIQTVLQQDADWLTLLVQ